jgi:hypothetical protein
MQIFASSERKKWTVYQALHFLDKEYILISRRYQLHPASATTQCPSGNTDAHSQLKQKKKFEIEKVLL